MVEPGPIKSVELLEEERITHTQHLAPATAAGDRSKDIAIATRTAGGVLTSAPKPDGNIRLGILGTDRTNRQTVTAIRNPISLCTVSAVASKERTSGEKFVESWCHHPLSGSPDDIGVFVGEDSYMDLVESEGLIDAIFIPHPDTLQKDVIIRSFECNKHVIMDLPVEMTLSDTFEIINAAKKAGKLFMDGSKFVHHHRTQEFLRRVADHDFGPINQIDIEFSIAEDDTTMDEHIWLSQHENCISSLGWFCARMAIALLGETGGLGKIKTAQIKDLVKDEAGNPVDAKAEVEFENGCQLTFRCSFTRSTKQSVKVFGKDHSAEMFDTFHSHDIFTSFQVHSKQFSMDKMIQGPIDVVDSIECRSGPLQDAFIWRKFGALCHAIDDAVLAHQLPLQSAEWPVGPASKEANMLLASTVETQMIIDALMESARKDCARVSLPSGS
mmetsp:Transcript_11712/g.26212  ORF Transcript_11712/g.26212 Transcript_11712/m.26212 type:complete len:442 (-) Transcript_11712:94-1419(-)